MRGLWLTTDRLSHVVFFFFSLPFLILIKDQVQDKHCQPTLQLKERGPLRDVSNDF